MTKNLRKKDGRRKERKKEKKKERFKKGKNIHAIAEKMKRRKKK